MLSSDEFDSLILPLKARVNDLRDAITDRDEQIRKLEAERDSYKIAYRASLKTLQGFSSDEEAEEQGEGDTPDAGGIVQGLEGARDPIRPDIPHVPARGNRVIVLLDGDGAIFSDDLLVRGLEGGLDAAERLSTGIGADLRDNAGDGTYHIWVFGFLNMRGLASALHQTRLIKGKILENFVLGFNKSSGRFMMLDVGSAKEAADAKLRALLEDETRTPHTIRVYFAGCHDDGYATTLHSLITEGHRHKLVLLQSYTEMAKEFSSLNLPCFAVPGLFRPTKIVTPMTSPKAARMAKQTLSPRSSTFTSPRSSCASIPNSPDPRTTSMSLPPLPLPDLDQLPDTHESAECCETSDVTPSNIDSLHRDSESAGPSISSIPSQATRTLKLDPNKLLSDRQLLSRSPGKLLFTQPQMFLCRAEV